MSLSDKEQQDYNNLVEIIDGIGLYEMAKSGIDGYYSFNDKSIEEAFKKVSNNLQYIDDKHHELDSKYIKK